MSKTLDLLKAQGKIAAWYDFKAGSLADKSGNGNNLTVNNSPKWSKTSRGWAVDFKQMTSNLSCADSASLRLQEGVFMIFGKISEHYAQQMFSHLAAGTGTAVLFYASSATVMSVYDGVTASNVIKSILGAKMLAVKFKNGQVPDFFLDGANVGKGHTAISIPTPPSGGLYVGGWSALSNSIKSPINDFILLNSASITNEQISDIYSELMAERGYGDAKTGNFHVSSPKDETGKCVLHWDMMTKTGDGKMLDRSGNGRHGTVSRANKIYDNPFDCLKVNGTSSSVALTNGYTNTMSGNQRAALSIWLKTDDLSNMPVIVDGASDTFNIELAANTVYVRCSATTRTYTVSGMSNGKWVHIYFEKTGSGDLGNLYVNGVLQSSYSGTLGDMPTAAGSDLRVGGNAAANAFFLTGAFYDFRLYSSNLTAAERTKLYLDGAKRLMLNIPMAQDTNVTLANVTAGPVGNSLWNVYSGTWSIVEANGRKWLNCLGGYSAYTQQNSAYGTFYWKTYLGSALTNNVYFNPMGTGKGVGAFGNGYYVRVSTAGKILLYTTAPTMIAETADGYLAAGVYYEFALTRSMSGKFNLYVKGGAYSAWTLALTVTNNTYTSSVYAIVSAEAAQSYRVSDFRVLNGVIDPTVNPELIPN